MRDVHHQGVKREGFFKTGPVFVGIEHASDSWIRGGRNDRDADPMLLGDMGISFGYVESSNVVVEEHERRLLPRN